MATACHQQQSCTRCGSGPGGSPAREVVVPWQWVQRLIRIRVMPHFPPVHGANATGKRRDCGSLGACCAPTLGRSRRVCRPHRRCRTGTASMDEPRESPHIRWCGPFGHRRVRRTPGEREDCRRLDLTSVVPAKRGQATFARGSKRSSGSIWPARMRDFSRGLPST